jgi:hypothetical protein
MIAVTGLDLCLRDTVRNSIGLLVNLVKKTAARSFIIMFTEDKKTDIILCQLNPIQVPRVSHHP